MQPLLLTYYSTATVYCFPYATIFSDAVTVVLSNMMKVFVIMDTIPPHQARAAYVTLLCNVNYDDVTF